MNLWKEIARTMFAIGQEDEYYGGGEGAEPSQYELEMAARKQQREMDRQLKAYGREAMELDPKLRLEDAARGVTLEDHQKSLQLRMPGSKPPKKDAKDPLRDLMKQMKLTMGPDILEETAGTNNTDTKATVVELPQYDDRGPAPLKNPQKAHVRHPNDGAHGLCLTTGFCGAWVGGVSSGKSTCLQSCLAHNHARYRFARCDEHGAARVAVLCNE